MHNWYYYTLDKTSQARFDIKSKADVRVWAFQQINWSNYWTLGVSLRGKKNNQTGCLDIEILLQSNFNQSHLAIIGQGELGPQSIISAAWRCSHSQLLLLFARPCYSTASTITTPCILRTTPYTMIHSDDMRRSVRTKW